MGLLVRSSSRGESTDTETTEAPGSEEEESQDAVPSLLDKLQAPRPSDLARKWKIAANPPCGKGRSRGAIGGSDLKTIQQEKRVRDYPNEPLTAFNTVALEVALCDDVYVAMSMRPWTKSM